MGCISSPGNVGMYYYNKENFSPYPPRFCSARILSSPVSVVINGFFPKTGAWAGAEQLLTQPAALALVMNIFLLPPVLFIEYTLVPYFAYTIVPSLLRPPEAVVRNGFRDGTLPPLCVHTTVTHISTFWPEMGVRLPVKISRSSSSGLYVTMSTGKISSCNALRLKLPVLGATVPRFEPRTSSWKARAPTT